jgi:hypothetical protein
MHRNAATFTGISRFGMPDEDSPHHSSSNAEKLRVIVPVHAVLLPQVQVRLVH